MKNAIRYYYNLYADNIHQVEKQYRFQIEKENYILYPVDIAIEDMNDVYQLSEQLINRGILCHKIILNQQNQIVTFINQAPFVLMKTNFYKPEPVILNDCLYLTQYAIHVGENGRLKRNHWYQLWTKKIDYLEYQLSQFGKKFPVIRESFGYYIGLSENCISYLQQLKLEQIPLYVTHRRIQKKDTIVDFYNPLYFVVDYRIRDTSEYYKMRFFEGIPVLEEIERYIRTSQLTADEIKLFYCRMLFPTYYFDLYEQIIAGEIPEKKLLSMISKVDEYEQFLKDLYFVLYQITPLPEIEWLYKKM